MCLTMINKSKDGTPQVKKYLRQSGLIEKTTVNVRAELR